MSKMTKFQAAEVEEMIRKHNHLIKLINAPVSEKRENLIKQHLAGVPLEASKDPASPKLRELARIRKQQREEAHRKVVADKYLKRFTEMSHETADYFKQKTINLYITE